MGIFAEDLINLGNLLGVEIELKLTAEDMKKVFKDTEFILEDGLLKLRRKRKGFIFSRTSELRLREDSRNVLNDREKGLRCIKAQVLSRSALEDFKNAVSTDTHDLACFNLWEVIKNTELYEKIPKQFRERIIISRYTFKKDYLQLYLKVEK